MEQACAQYTVYRCASMSSDERVGPIHASDDGNVTLCGREADERWWISTNTGITESVTCKKCHAHLQPDNGDT